MYEELDNRSLSALEFVAMNDSMICIGHRGAMGYKPENTLSSFELAIEMGCPWLELDVYAIENELVVIHDDTLERTTNGKGNVVDHSFAQLRALDAGDGQQIPTLGEVIDRVARRAVINIELKGPGTAAPVSALLDDYCRTGWSPDDFLVSSFKHSELARAKPVYRRGALISRRSRTDPLAVSEQLSAWSVNLELSAVDQAIVDRAHGKGLKVLVYTVNESDDIARMRALGVDGVFTNYPDRVL